MLFALNENGNRIRVTSKGQTGKCPLCSNKVKSRFGKIKIPHWYHSINNCDSWSEPISEWHLKWQNSFPVNNQEVVLKDNKTREKHIADILLNNGVVIEFQNSPISPTEIEERESFYSRGKGLIWVLNGKNLLEHCDLYVIEYPSLYLINIIINYFDSKSYYIDNIYDYEMLYEEFMNSRTLIKLRENEYLTQEFKNIEGHRFYFNRELNFEEIKLHILEDIRFLCNKLLLDFEYVSSRIEFEIIIRHKQIHCRLNKKYWRKFIDRMRSPVFIDNLEGLNDDELYWYQENITVKKSVFIDKYLKYT